MSKSLRIVSESELARAKVIQSWLNSFESQLSRQTMMSILRSVLRATSGVGAEASVDVTAFEWELLADSTVFEVVREAVRLRYGKQSPKYLQALRSLLRHLARRNFCDFDDAMRTLEENRVRRVVDDPLPLTFTDADLRRLFGVCHRDTSRFVGSRDLALLAVATSTGARRRELVGIELTDLDITNRTVILHTKGGRQRTAVLNHAVPPYLDDWLSRRGDGQGPLFPALRRGGNFTERAMSDHQFWKILRDRCQEAGVQPGIRPHDLRRWFVTSLLDTGVDIFQVAKAVGHVRIETTQRYDRRSFDRLREVVDKLSLPLFEELDGDEGVTPS